MRGSQSLTAGEIQLSLQVFSKAQVEKESILKIANSIGIDEEMIDDQAQRTIQAISPERTRQVIYFRKTDLR